MSKGSCTFCGERFDNVFEAVDHVEPEFSPKFILSHNVKLNMTESLYYVYLKGNDELKEWAETIFSWLYLAEKRPSERHYGNPERVKDRVYDIIGEDSFRKLEQ